MQYLVCIAEINTAYCMTYCSVIYLLRKLLLLNRPGYFYSAYNFIKSLKICYIKLSPQKIAILNTLYNKQRLRKILYTEKKRYSTK